MSRYSRNYSTVSIEEQIVLRESKVCVVGCGGLGGYIIEMLGRIGVGYITAVDGDVFEESNPNRQIVSKVDNLGYGKSIAAKLRMKSINPEINVKALNCNLDRNNANEILKNYDVIVDALDNIESRFIIQDYSQLLKIPFVHGAIAGWYGQVTTIFPEDKTLNKIYENREVVGEEKKLGNPSFTPALVASIQTAEVVKILLKRGDVLRNKLLYIDLLSQDYDILEL